jgi:hypothetical protein
LRLHPSISAFYVGTETGEFFLVRPLRAGSVAGETLEPPPRSAYAVQIIERLDDGAIRETLVFFDDNLVEIERRPTADAEFDPRGREWYRRGIGTDGQITTDFYIFFTTGEVGLTFARRLAGGGGVVGADLTLEDLEEALDRERVTPSTRIAIADANGRVIALSDAELTASLQTGSRPGSVSMPRLSEVSDPVYRALADRLAENIEPGRFDLEIDGRRWLASVTVLATRSGDGVLLSILIPLSELLTDVDRIRNRSLLISGALLDRDGAADLAQRVPFAALPRRRSG